MSANLRAALATSNDRTPVADPGLASLALSHYPGDVALLRDDLTVEWINDRFARRLGLPAGACAGLNWLALHPTAAIQEEEYRRACRGEGVMLAPFPFAGPDGLRNFAANLQPPTRDGAVVGLLVTEHSVAATTLTGPGMHDGDPADSRDRFALALECAQLGFYEWDVPADTLYGLDAWCALYGLPAESGSKGHDARWESRVHPDDLPALRRSYAAHFASQSALAEIEYRLRASDGRWIWVFDRSQVTARLPDGSPWRVSGVCMQIDDRKRTELALRDSETRVAAAMWGVGFGLWELDVTTQRARWFSDWCETEGLFPCEGPDHVGMWDAHIHPEDLPRAARLFSDLLENRHDVYEAEYRIRTRSNEWRWIMERCRAAERGCDGRPLRVVGVCMNIHARKLGEMALRESQLHLRAIAENTSDWLTLLDAEQRVLFLNRPLGAFTPEQVMGRLLPELLPADQKAMIGGFVAAVLSGSPRRELEFTGQHPQLGSRYLLIRAQTVLADGRAVGVVITTTDITQRRRNEQLLQLQARILETMREGVVLVDSQDRIRLTNPAFEQIFGSAPGELVGQSIEPLFRPGEGARLAADRRLREQLTTSRAEPVEFECARVDGSTFCAACVVTPLSVDGADHWLAVLNDVTDRRILEREILEVSNREQQRIGNDLHDGLGQELTGVAMMLRGLATRIRHGHPQALPEIDGIIQLLGQSIHNARTLARGLSPVSLERGGLLPALRTLTTRARESYGLSVTLRTRSALPMRLDEGSANHLYRIVQEALSNAVRHGRATRVKIQVTVDEHLIRIAIHDNGRGLPEGGAPETGLGLRTMRYRARMVGGDVQIANHRLGGTVVRCICPQGAREPQSLELARARAHARAHARAPAPARPIAARLALPGGDEDDVR